MLATIIAISNIISIASITISRKSFTPVKLEDIHPVSEPKNAESIVRTNFKNESSSFTLSNFIRFKTFKG